ncbi:MAG: phage scaffolding protein [Candidatus Pelethousia sp.]|nr:phage scaffolding protein [Candidatus Pelethousia sp.]
MEFLKALFGDKPLTYDEFVAAVGAAKDIKLVNLSSGQYVDKGKLDDKENELKTANDTIKALQDTVKKFDGVDVDALKNAATATETKYKGQLDQLRRDSAIQLALVQAKARNPKAARALLDDSKIALNADGTLSGLDVEALKKSDPYLFEIEKKQDEGSGHEGGGDPGPKGGEGTLRDSIVSALYGTK